MDEQTTGQTSGGKHITLDVYTKGQQKFLAKSKAAWQADIQSALDKGGSYETATEDEVLSAIEGLFTADGPQV